ncbi:MAG: hypothetical protein J6A61_05905 [Clostridia bacterium]|nr:hypothetical protein [Clostridia bacterium]
MKVNVHKPTFRINPFGLLEIAFPVCYEYRNVFDGIEFNKDVYELDIKKLRKHRSLDANRYFWALVREIALLLRTSEDEVYLGMLERYGVFEIFPIAPEPEKMESLKRKWRLVVDMGDCEVNETKMRKVKCFYGSSQYDTVEMAHLIDGTISECQRLGIPTLPPEEVERMVEAWGKA